MLYSVREPRQKQNESLTLREMKHKYIWTKWGTLKWDYSEIHGFWVQQRMNEGARFPVSASSPVEGYVIAKG